MDTMGRVCHAEASWAFGVNPLSDVARPAGRRAPSLWSSPTLCPQGDHKVSRLHRTSPRHGSPFLRRPPSASAHLFLSSEDTPTLPRAPLFRPRARRVFQASSRPSARRARASSRHGSSTDRSCASRTSSWGRGRARGERDRSALCAPPSSLRPNLSASAGVGLGVRLRQPLWAPTWEQPAAGEER